MAHAQGARSLMAAAFETTYGTAPVGGCMRMPFASTSLGAEQPLLGSGLLTATAKLIAQGEAIAASTAAGTPTGWTLQRFGHFNGSIKRNGTSLGNIVSADIQYANNLDRIETIRSDGRIDGADPSIAALTGKMDVRFADQVLMTQAMDSTPAEMEFAYSLGSGESLTVTVHAVYLPRPRIEIQDPQGVQASFDWQAAYDATAGQMCTVTLVNDIATY